ncbi:MAG: transglycosylase SLT domain-containing protein [Melioribacteraceae bacterium]|nr:MAG: transglycosylase SLT domain-containing protein [Melioribacteraceae bacterium]
MEELKLKITNSLKHIADTQSVNKTERYSEPEKRKIAGASKDFESMLTSMMLKSMTSSVEGFFGEDSYGGDYFDSIFTMELASKISEGNSLGIAQQIYQKVTGEKWDDSIMNPQQKVNFDDLRMQINQKNKLDAEQVNLGGSKVDKISPSNHSLKRLEKYEPVISKFADKFEVDKNLIRSIILAESAAKPDAVSTAKAKGLMQLMDGTAKEMGVKNSFDPVENIHGGTKYFTHLLRKYSGNIPLSLAAYNAGPGNVEKYNGIPPFDETKNYVNRVLGYYNYFNG